MFDLADKRLAWIKVRFPGFRSNGDAPGEVVEHEIELQVDLVDRDEFGRLFLRPDEAEKPEEAKAYDALTELDRFKSVVSNWRGVAMNGASVSFTDDHIKRLLNVPNFGDGFNTAYLLAWQGKADTRTGNSNGSLANGQASGPAAA